MKKKKIPLYMVLGLVSLSCLGIGAHCHLAISNAYNNRDYRTTFGYGRYMKYINVHYQQIVLASIFDDTLCNKQKIKEVTGYLRTDYYYRADSFRLNSNPLYHNLKDYFNITQEKWGYVKKVNKMNKLISELKKIEPFHEKKKVLGLYRAKIVDLYGIELDKKEYEKKLILEYKSIYMQQKDYQDHDVSYYCLQVFEDLHGMINSIKYNKKLNVSQKEEYMKIINEIEEDAYKTMPEGVY